MPPESPRNGQYMVAAYIITGAIYLAYALALWIRVSRSNRT
jgi:hypothetical protein